MARAALGTILGGWLASTQIRSAVPSSALLQCRNGASRSIFKGFFRRRTFQGVRIGGPWPLTELQRCMVGRVRSTTWVRCLTSSLPSRLDQRPGAMGLTRLASEKAMHREHPGFHDPGLAAERASCWRGRQGAKAQGAATLLPLVAWANHWPCWKCIASRGCLEPCAGFHSGEVPCMTTTSAAVSSAMSFPLLAKRNTLPGAFQRPGLHWFLAGACWPQPGLASSPVGWLDLGSGNRVNKSPVEGVIAENAVSPLHLAARTMDRRPTGAVDAEMGADNPGTQSMTVALSSAARAGVQAFNLPARRVPRTWQLQGMDECKAPLAWHGAVFHSSSCWRRFPL